MYLSIRRVRIKCSVVDGRKSKIRRRLPSVSTRKRGFSALKIVYLGASRILRKSSSYGMIDRVENGAFVRKLDLKLTRMYVYVNGVWSDLNIDNAARDLFGRYIRGIRLFDRRHTGLGLDVSAVNEEILIIAVGSRGCRSRNEAGYPDPVAVALDLEQIVCSHLRSYRA